MPQKINNSARALLMGSIAPSDTSMVIEAPLADSFPIADTGVDAVNTPGKDWFKAVLEDTSGNKEIVYVRTRSGGSATLGNLLRGMEGTTARTYVAGSVVGIRITASDLTPLSVLAGASTAADIRAAISVNSVAEDSALLTALGDTKVARTAATGAAILPAGNTAQRDVSPIGGYLRFNSDTQSFEGYKNGSWGNVGGGATGGGTDSVFVENDTDIADPWEVGEDAMISGVTVTIASPAVFTLSNHGFVAGRHIRLKTTGALPTGLTATDYYVIATGLTSSTFQVAATRGGAAINTSGTQSGVHSVGKCKNANTAGPVTILDSGSVVQPDGCAWVITG